MSISIRVIPVLDLKAGLAVHAVAGDRAHYRPLRTRLHRDSDPLGVALGFRDALRLRDLYLADLDAIAGAPPNLALYESIRSLGLDLWVDAGLHDRASLPPLLGSGVSTIVAGLETVRGPDALRAIVDDVPPGRLVFSLDLRDGRPLMPVDGPSWGTDDPTTLAGSVVAMGVRRLLLLDLARVGTGRGTGTTPLVSLLNQAHPEVEITVGGGIAGRDEVQALARAGADAVLIGSALHDGRIGVADLPARPGSDIIPG